MIIDKDYEDVRVITLNSTNKHNPFSIKLEDSIKAALSRASFDDKVKSVVIYGGEDRSFSAGGDFKEVKLLSRKIDIENWIDRVIDLYLSVLKLNKPTVAAIDGYAIGMGFQFAMMFDQRIMSSEATFMMPELKHGIGCSVGAAILNFTHGFNLMQKIIYQCSSLDAKDCEKYHLVNKIAKKENLLNEAIREAKIMSAYPKTSFVNTKKTINKTFIDLLDNIRETSKLVHTASFQARDAQKHFCKILNESHEGV